MPSIRFANVLLETKPRALKYPTLYYRAEQPFVFDTAANADVTADNASAHANTANVWTLVNGGSVDFTTYFNALSVMKLREYTRANAFVLHLEVRGASATVSQTRAERLSMTPETVESNTVHVDANNEWTKISLPLVVNDETVLAAFRIDADGPFSIRNGHYEVDYDGEARDVELAIATTTFRKEQFIINNINMIKNELLAGDTDIAKHLRMHVIDNGRTLDAAVLSDGRVTVSPNDNVGGAGGFARGMIEAMEQDVPATHVLLMDDDVEVSSESILRTYNLLRIVNDEYKDAFIDGAMLNIEDIETMKEDTGYIDPGRGTCVAAKDEMNVSQFVDIVNNETYDVALSIPQGARRYGAWWYCCIPTHVIERNGLPLPIFVRFDDVEYGIRCNPKFMTMNGIAVWHAKFEIRYNAGVERYQTVRNSMIAQMTTGLAPSMETFLTSLKRMLDMELKNYNYTDAELALQGFEDFLKGPDFIEQPVVQEAFMRANREKEQLVSFDELTQQAHDMGFADFDPTTITQSQLELDGGRSLKDRALDYVTRNGQRLWTRNADAFDDYAIIPAAGWTYHGGIVHAKNVIIAIDWATRRGVIRTKNLERYKQVQKRFKRDMSYYKKHERELAEQYLSAAPKLESKKFWKQYLHMD